MLDIKQLHHVSLSVTSLERAKRFYADVLGLPELPRPPFDFPGAWFQLGDRQLHLIVGEHSTLRHRPVADSRHIHFAIRVASYRAAIEHLAAQGYRPDAAEPLRRTKEKPDGAVGYPQVFLVDPDLNVIEINAERLD